MARIWDANKKIIKPVATGLAGFLGTPALGALVGAAMGGFDREGKGGIGFDAKQGAIGGVTGYGMGSLGSSLGATGIGQSLGGGSLSGLNHSGGTLANRFLGNAAPKATAVPSAYSGTLSPTDVATAYTKAGVAAPAMEGVVGATGAPAAGGALATQAPTGSVLTKLGSSIKANPTAWGMGLQGAGQLATAGAQNRQADAEGRLVSAKADEQEYANERKKQSDIALESLRERLAAQLAGIGSQSSAPASTYAGFTPRR